MSLLTYNGITLPYTSNTRFKQEVVYDPSNTDWYCTKYDIQTRCVITPLYLPMIASKYENITGVSSAEIMRVIRRDLMQPRRRLSLKCNGIELIPFQTGVGTVDAQNGPQPKYCEIISLTNESFIITYHIIAHYWERIVTGTNLAIQSVLNGNTVLYNRWEESVNIDNCMYTTRTRRGHFAIRSDNESGAMADMLRTQMAVISVPRGFLRQSAEFTIDPSGLKLNYTLVDKEVFRLPPRPAFEAEGQYAECSSRGGAIKYGDVRLRLKGCKDPTISPQPKLLAVALQIAMDKLDIRGAMLLESGEVRVGMYENWVEVHLRAMLNTSKKGWGGTVISDKEASKTLLKDICAVAGSNGSTASPNYLPRGTASLLMQAAAYNDPDLQARLGTELPGTLDNAPVNNTENIYQMKPGLRPGEAGNTNEAGLRGS